MLQLRFSLSCIPCCSTPDLKPCFRAPFCPNNPAEVKANRCVHSTPNDRRGIETGRPNPPVRLPLEWYLPPVGYSHLTDTGGTSLTGPDHDALTIRYLLTPAVLDSAPTLTRHKPFIAAGRRHVLDCQSTAGPSSPSLCQVCTAAGKLVPFSHSLPPSGLYHGSLPFSSLIGLCSSPSSPSSLLFLNQHGTSYLSLGL